MNKQHIALAILILAMVCAMPAVMHADAGQPASAQKEQRAGLIVQFGDGNYVTRCISFAEKSITGLELLIRSGLRITTWGTAVCRIEQEGCDYPAQRCFCQCLATPCRYWSYWHRRDGRWAYSQVGAGYHRVRDGDIDAWLWGDGQSPPSVVPFEQICTSTEPPTGRNTLALTPIPTATPEPAAQLSSNASYTPSPAAAPAPTGSPGAPLVQYAAFALVAAALLGGFFVRSRHQER
jgi:hypothetical protein